MSADVWVLGRAERAQEYQERLKISLKKNILIYLIDLLDYLLCARITTCKDWTFGDDSFGQDCLLKKIN